MGHLLPNSDEILDDLRRTYWTLFDLYEKDDRKENPIDKIALEKIINEYTMKLQNARKKAMNMFKQIIKR